MHRFLLLAFLLTILSAPEAMAQPASLDYGEDYTYAGEVHEVVTVEVAPNRVNHYLAGLKRGWVPSQKIGMEMGLSKDYKIYVSELPAGSGFNVMLVTIYENPAQRHRLDDPATEAEFDRRVEAQLSEQESFEIQEGYTQIREILGHHLMREVELK